MGKKLAMKRPSSARTGSRTFKSVDTGLMTKFKLKKFVRGLWQKAGYRLTDSRRWPILRVSTSCSGTGTPIYVLQAMLGKEWVQELYAVERDPAAVSFLIRNFDPGCVFQERFCCVFHPTN